MKRNAIAPCLVIALAGLLVGWAGLASAAPPVGATLVQPTGVIGGSTFTFTWRAADGATFYYLQVNDATASPRLTLWYPAAMACPGGSATCTATLTGGWAAGDAVWWIQTWNSDGYGPWSAGMRFAVNYVPGAWGQSLSPTDRFQLVMGGVAVLDRETGLVWERTPGAGGATTWDLAVAECPRRPVGGRLGWRLPTYEEQASLVDPAQTDPALPPGHPFSNANAFFWSASTSPTDPTYVLGMNFRFGSPNSGLKTSAFPYWCVRGGQTAQSPQ